MRAAVLFVPCLLVLVGGGVGTKASASSLRGYRLPWTGDPGGKPLVAVVGDRVYASWDGKGGIARWQVLAGPDPDHLAVIASRPWGGLETVIGLETPPKVVAVRALDASGHALGRSETLTP